MPELVEPRSLTRSRRKREIRARTIMVNRLTKRERDAERVKYPDLDHWRPATRAECESGCRPCPYVGCRWNLYLDVTTKGNVKFNFPDLEPHQMRVSCALDVANKGSHPLEEVGELMNITRERIRQVEQRAKGKVGPELARLLDIEEIQ